MNTIFVISTAKLPKNSLYLPDPKNCVGQCNNPIPLIHLSIINNNNPIPLIHLSIIINSNSTQNPYKPIPIVNLIQFKNKSEPYQLQLSSYTIHLTILHLERNVNSVIKILELQLLYLCIAENILMI